jgi:hypothetical protein
MPTVQELTDRYDSYSDQELFGVWIRINEYAPEAQEALKAIINRKGGPEALVQRLQLQAERATEIQRLTQEARISLHKGIPPSRVKDQMRSAILGADAIAEIADKVVAEQQQAASDRKITPRAFLGALVGGLLGGTVAGAVLGFSMIQSGKVMVIFLLGPPLLGFGFIRFFTGKTTRNNLVVVATALSTVYAFALAGLIYILYR